MTGFAEGSGAFTYSRSDRNLTLYFALRRGAGDDELLVAIRNFFGGAGRIYLHRLRSQPAPSYFRVSRIGELGRIVQHFEEYPLRGAKARAFSVWREMVALKERFRKPDREKLEALAGELSTLSRGDVGGS